MSFPHKCPRCGREWQCNGCDDINGPCADCAKLPPTLPLLSALAHAAATSLDAFAAVTDDVKIEPGRASLDPVLLAARVNAHETLRLLSEALYERRRIMHGDEVNRLRVCVANGVVAGSWAIRVKAIAAEMGDGDK